MIRTCFNFGWHTTYDSSFSTSHFAALAINRHWVWGTIHRQRTRLLILSCLLGILLHETMACLTKGAQERYRREPKKEREC